MDREDKIARSFLIKGCSSVLVALCTGVYLHQQLGYLWQSSTMMGFGVFVCAICMLYVQSLDSSTDTKARKNFLQILIGGCLPALLYGHADLSGVHADLSDVHADLNCFQQVDPNRNRIWISDVEQLLAVVVLICTAVCFIIVCVWSWDPNRHEADTVVSRVFVIVVVFVRFDKQLNAMTRKGANPFGVLISVLTTIIIHLRDESHCTCGYPRNTEQPAAGRHRRCGVVSLWTSQIAFAVTYVGMHGLSNSHVNDSYNMKMEDCFIYCVITGVVLLIMLLVELCFCVASDHAAFIPAQRTIVGAVVMIFHYYFGEKLYGPMDNLLGFAYGYSLS